MSYVDHIVEVFGGVRPMAAAIKKQPSTVQSWKVRGSIPDEHKKLIWEKAQERGLALRAEHFVPFPFDNPTCGDAA